MDHARGFSVVEMLVVMLVSVVLMTMVLPVFAVSTRTVKAVETKLEVYQSARNILDALESTVQQAYLNERGGMFALKSAYFMDTDPFTPDGTNPDGTKRYWQSRREADGIWFNHNEMQGMRYNYNADIVATLPHPFDYPMHPAYNEVYRSAITAGLLYKSDGMRNAALGDVSQILFSGASDARVCNWYPSPQDEPINFFVPGNDFHWENGDQANAIRVMDFDIAYWDDTAQAFLDPPDNTGIYFAPLPKALRFTITVCDRNKRTHITLCRVVHLPSGTGQGTLDPSQSGADSVYFDPTGNISQFQRVKDLKTLEPRLFSTGP